MTRSISWCLVLLCILILPGCGFAPSIVTQVVSQSDQAEQQADAAPETVKDAPSTKPGDSAAQPTPSEDASKPAPPPSAVASSGQSPLAEDASQRVGIPTFAGGLPELRYQWKQGENYVYDVRIEAEVGDTIHTHSGRISLTATETSAPVAKSSRAKDKPTATAFAVTPDGYLLTCEHVVAGASTLEVSLGGKTYKAKVIGIDKPKDLALIRIDATGLPVVPLADSERIEIGQEVRAIGFPLSSVLGDSLKATRGTVAGMDSRRGHKLIQVDAAVNPGNSGGPLVNEQGEVVGVISAKLAGSIISNVGFAVPANDAKALLSKHKVTASGKGAANKLDGPALVRAVSPAVALVTVTLRDGAASTIGEVATLRYSGYLSESQREKNPQPFRRNPFARLPRGPSMRGPSIVSSEVKVDVLGNIQETEGGESLPYMLGNAAHLVLEPLSEYGEETWETVSTTTIIERERDERFGPTFMPRRFGPRGFAAPEEPQGTKYTATERTEYRVERSEGDTAVIHKKYELKTEHEEGQQPYLALRGEGDITFDLKQGLPVKMSYKGAVSVSKENISVQIPLTLTYKLLTEVELKELAEKAAAAKKAAEAAAAKAAAAKPEPPARTELSDDEIDTNLALLKSGNLLDRQRAANAFLKASPTAARREAVARALEKATTDSHLFTRVAAIKALALWGNAESVPVLVECLKSTDSFSRGEALGVLEVLGDDRAAEAVVAALKEFSSRRKAAVVIRKIGSPCEAPLAKMLGDERDISLRRDICGLLKDIGTQASIGALETAAKDSSTLVSQAAEQALQAIKARK